MSDEVVVRIADAEVIRGQDGFSPIFSSEAIPGGHLVRVEDVNGQHEFNVLDGARGKTGATGAKGDKGDPGNYTKPTTGIPKSDLASSVQTSLGKADAAIQLGLTGASVGDLVRVAAVNASGKPTSWSHVPLCDITTNPNLLDNWYFVGGGSQQGDGIFPINQRGKTVYPGAGYSIDRWNSSNANGTLTITQDAVTLSASSSGNAFFRQLVKKLPSNAVITVSALIRGSGAGALRVDNETGTSTIFNAQSYNNPGSAWTLISGSGTLPDGVGIVTLRANASTSIDIAALKCELGAEQTLAHQENDKWVLNELPEYETELIKCKTSTVDPTDIYANKTIGYNVSNRNLLDNWYFVGGGSQRTDVSECFPINQRGLTTYPNGDFSIDRWKNVSGTLTISQNGIYLSGIQQLLKKACIVDGLNYTMSVYCSLGLLTITHSLDSSISGWQINSSLGGLWTGVRYTNGVWDVRITSNDSTVLIYAVKLELGTEQTLAHLENGVWVLNEIPDWAEEMAACQQYYFPIPSAFRINATYRSSSNIDFSFSIPVRMIGTVRFVAPSAKLFASTGSGGAFEEQSGFTYLIPDNSTGNGLVVIRASKSGHGLIQTTAIVLQPYTNAYLTTYPVVE